MPCQTVPASWVTKTSKSIPAAVSVGAVPPGQRVPAGQFIVCDPAFVRIRENPQSSSAPVGFENVKVVVLVSIVALTLLPSFRSMS